MFHVEHRRPLSVFFFSPRLRGGRLAFPLSAKFGLAPLAFAR
ncbi:hypothetical protein HMPREF7215_1025 [Pyramidobacter piscolens W5455]|uniref:Uncharacterized protein n=1 Tax=Pyramidobacter piscolens W5455 TaxID=352165 RepID=A0ABP2HQD6_9BACT|nr:hypothetical protein HMPREF7215_1025 [Pyramidobacter piscolens W5455]